MDALSGELRTKLERLRADLAQMQRVVVAYSGGVDSTFLLAAAHEVLGRQAVGVTAASETMPGAELNAAREIAAKGGYNHIVITTKELENEEFTQNSPLRCFYCKTELFSKIQVLASELGIEHILDGSNADDLRDYRPGHKAAKAYGVKSPLQDVGLSKEEIRRLSREMGLSTWNKPSCACLSSRFPYGDRITTEKLRQVELAENHLHQRGFTEVRVRCHGSIARIELPPADFPRLLAAVEGSDFIASMKAFGFTYITLDVLGLRSGSMNEILQPAEEKENGPARLKTTA